MKNLLIAFVLIIFATTISAQNEFKQTISGIVTDKDSDIPLPGVTIMIKDSDPLIGTVTDLDGKFILEDIPVGRISLRFQYIGYKTTSRENLLLNSGKQLRLMVSMEENIEQLKAVTITANKNKGQAINEMAVVSARAFTIEETNKFAGSWGDPSRMVQNYAGVATAGDSRNDIIIRSNSPVGVLWRLNGVNILNPNHFGASGSTGGPVSILNNNVLSNSDFFTGAWPAEYGNAIAGVFDLKMRHGNPFKREHVGQVGYNGFELGTEGPFVKNKSGTYLVNYRYSTLGLMKTLGMDFGVGVPEYQDINLHASFPTKNAGTFEIIGLGGISSIVFEEESSSMYTDGSMRTKNGSNMGILSFSHTYFTKKKTKIYSYASLSSSIVKTTLDTADVNTNEKHIYYDERNEEQKMSLSTNARHKFNSKNTISTGVSADLFNLNYIDSVFVDSRYITTTDEKQNNLFLLQAYSQWQHKFNNSVSFNLGLHYQQFTYNNTWALEPRFGFKYQFTENQSLSFGYGLHSQTQPFLYYFTQTLSSDSVNYHKTNENLDLTRSHHAVIGYKNQLGKNWSFKTEVYYQYLYNIPVEINPSYYSAVNTGAEFHQYRVDSLTNEGTAENYGVELTLEKFLSSGYYFLLTGSVFDSKYKTLDGEERNSVFNGNFLLNVLGGYEFVFSEKASLSVNVRMVWGGGQRYRYIDLDASILDENTVYDDAKSYAERRPDYFRLDSRLSFKLNSKKFTQEWSLDIQNITNHKNLYIQNYNNSTKSLSNYYQVGLYPMFFYRIIF